MSLFVQFQRCPCWNTCCGVECQEKWLQFRTAVLSVVDTPAFEWFILVLIFASSITLCFEDIYLDSNLWLKRLLYWTNFVFSMVFVVEMVLKWLALGFTRYFTSFWTILDFIIVFVRISCKLYSAQIQQKPLKKKYRAFISMCLSIFLPFNVTGVGFLATYRRK